MMWWYYISQISTGPLDLFLALKNNWNIWQLSWNGDHPRDDWVLICTSGYPYGVDSNLCSNWFMDVFVLYTRNFHDVGISNKSIHERQSCSFLHGIRNISSHGLYGGVAVPHAGLKGCMRSNKVNAAKLQCKIAGPGLRLFQWGGNWEHGMVKVVKLQCKTARHGPCLF